MPNHCTLAIVGDGSVGKSSIISSFKNDGFVATYRQTVGCEFYEKNCSVGGEMLSLRVWDIGGQSMNSKNLPQYLSSSDIIFVVYDVTNTESFSNLDDWLRVVKKHSPNAKIHIVGNKIDLISSRCVSKAMHDKYVEDNELVQSGLFMSARTGENVVKAFYKCAAEHAGIKLSAHELAYYDVVVKAHIVAGGPGDDDEGRTPWADEIEREDRLAQERSRNKKTCICS